MTKRRPFFRNEPSRNRFASMPPSQNMIRRAKAALGVEPLDGATIKAWWRAHVYGLDKPPG